jgi:hypothetical protein
MSLNSRLRRVAKQVCPIAPEVDPSFCIVVLHSKAPCLSPGPVKWGTVLNHAGFFEREADESEDAFAHRLMKARPDKLAPGEIAFVDIYAETMPPDLLAGLVP